MIIHHFRRIEKPVLLCYDSSEVNFHMRLMIDDRFDTMPWEQIDTVVFDVGNVLLSWQAQELLDLLVPERPDLHAELTLRIFKSPYWCMRDRGSATLEQVIAAMSKTAPELEPYVRRVMENWIDLPAMPEGVSALKACKAHGKRLYALEGYLSPNTYEIYTSSSADTIIKRLLSQTEAAYSLSYDERAQELGLTMDEVFTLASMIEKEAKKAEFAKVSAVFHNRLKQKMTLGSDVTIKYVSGSDKMVLGSGDLDLDSPYNTYRYKGLPIGPICNPSMDAVIAALYPDEQFLAQKYLYFCSTDPDSGSLHFSRTLEEHEAAVAMYRPLWEEYDRSRGL